MNRNNLIQRVASMVSDKMDGDTIMLIDSLIEDGLNNVCRFVAETKPKGHDNLLFTQNLSVDDATDSLGYVRWDVVKEVDYPIVIQDRFVKVEVLEDGETEQENAYDLCYPVNHIEALKLAEEHNKNYYLLSTPYLYFAKTEIIDEPYQLKLTHYIFATIGQFPDALSDLLVTEMVRLVQNEQAKQRLEGDIP